MELWKNFRAASYNSLPIDSNGVVQLEGADFINSVTELRQFTVFGVSHKIEDLELLANRPILEGLTSTGVTKRYMEIPNEQQRFVDGYNSNAYATDENGIRLPIDENYMLAHFQDILKGTAFGAHVDRAANAFVSTLEYSKENGIDVVFYDNNPDVYRKFPEMTQIHAERSRISDEFGEEQSQKYIAQLPEATQLQYETFVAEFNRERHEASRNMAERIIEDAGDERAVIDVGGGHLEHEDDSWFSSGYDDLDEFLGEDRVTSVQFFSSADDPYYRTFYENGLDMPNFFYFIEEEKGVIPPRDYDPNILDNISPLSSEPKIQTQEYDANIP